MTLTPSTPPSVTTDCSRVRPITSLEQSDLLPTDLKLEWRQTPCLRCAGPKPPSILSPQSWLVPALSLAFQQLLGSHELSQGPSHKILFLNVRWFLGLVTKRILKSTMTVTTSLSLWKLITTQHLNPWARAKCLHGESGESDQVRMVGAIQVLRIAGSWRLELKGEKKAPKVFEQGKDMDKTALQGTAQQCCGGWITRWPCADPSRRLWQSDWSDTLRILPALLPLVLATSTKLRPRHWIVLCYILLIRQAKEGEMTTLDD